MVENRAVLLGNQRFPWREIAKNEKTKKRLFDSTEVLNLRKISNICKWKEKVQKNTHLSFW